jgi:ATP-binding cassette subfamily B protein
MSTKAHPLRRLFAYADGYRSRLLRATAFSILNKLFDLAPPILIGFAIDIVVQREASFLASFGITELVNQLWVLAGVTLAVHLGESGFQYLYALDWRNLAQSMEHSLRTDTYEQVQRLEMGYYEDRSTGEMMSVLNDDVNQLERFLDNGANQIIQIVITVLVIGVIFFSEAPLGVALLAMLPMPFIVYGSVWFQKKLEPRYADVREEVGLLNSFLSNNLSGIATIKSFTSEQHEAERISEASDAYQQANREAIKLSAAFVPLIRMFIASGLVATIVGGGVATFNGELSVGVYGTLIFLTQRLLWPLTNLGNTFDLYQRAMASTTRILDLLDTTPGIPDGDTPLPRDQVRGHIQLEGVTFRYKDSDTVVEDLSLDIPTGQTVAIVGSTGAGKSTLVKLLLRFYDLDSGRITLDGHDLRDLKLSDLRSAIGLVSQDVYLFHGTVRENIAYGTFDATDEQIRQAAEVAEAHEFIMGLPDGYDTVVGERGQKLSGGQRQRISIARAVLSDPPVLILDEATSSVDNETEAAIQRSLEKIIVGRTTIMIAHRLSTVRNADRIYVLEHGEIREQGRHEDLVEQDGIYNALWRVQTGERGVFA